MYVRREHKTMSVVPAVLAGQVPLRMYPTQFINTNKEGMRTMQPIDETEYTRLAEIVGSLMISQFDGDQEAYRNVITEIFYTFAFNGEEENEQ